MRKDIYCGEKVTTNSDFYGRFVWLRGGRMQFPQEQLGAYRRFRRRVRDHETLETSAPCFDGRRGTGRLRERRGYRAKRSAAGHPILQLDWILHRWEHRRR